MFHLPSIQVLWFDLAVFLVFVGFWGSLGAPPLLIIFSWAHIAWGFTSVVVVGSTGSVFMGSFVAVFVGVCLVAAELFLRHIP